MIKAFKYECLFGLFNGDEKMDDCEFCGTAFADEHYLDTKDGLKLLQEQRG